MSEKANKKAKDSVFCDLFSEPKYLLQLYKALHPEDTEATEDQIGNVTLKNILVDQAYNDLGFTIGARLLVLVEAQSTWSENIVVRALMYLVNTWQEYIENHRINVYGSKKISLPMPELYVIYTVMPHFHIPVYRRFTANFFLHPMKPIYIKVLHPAALFYRCFPVSHCV